MISEEVLLAQLDRCLAAVDLSAVGPAYLGKVRDNFSTADGRRVIAVSDRVSAFDVVLGLIPFKGQVLNQLAEHWFRTTSAICPNHLLSVPDPVVTVARECRPLPVEMVVRAYLTGVTSTSIWYAYERGARTFCGHALPEGLRKNQRLERPIVTPSSKAAKGGHDRSMSRDEILAQGAITAAQFDEMSERSLAVFAEGARRVAERGLILVDTKYEFGVDPEGRIILIDEIHTPDSSRFWQLGSYDERFLRNEEPETLSKEYLRLWLVDQGYSGEGTPPPLPDAVRVEAARRYIAAYEQITGQDFVPDTSDPIVRIRSNLQKEGLL